MSPGDERKWVWGTWSKGVEWVGDRIESLSEAEVVQIGDVAEGWLPSELQVKSTVFNVIKDSETAAHDQLGVPEHIPGESKSRGEVVSIRKRQSAIGGSRIAWIKQTGGSSREFR